MGGYNSGRWGGRPTTSQSLTIALPLLFRRGWVTDHCASGGSLQWSSGGRQTGAIGYTYNLLDNHEPVLKLDFTWTPNGKEPQRVEQRIHLTATKPNYGGRRWWMICPFTGARVATLHLPPGGGKFASRKAWRLGYRSQRIARTDRPFETLYRLQRKLGSPEGWEAGLIRPKGMWNSTFERHLDRYFELDEQCSVAMDCTLAFAIARLGILKHK